MRLGVFHTEGSADDVQRAAYTTVERSDRRIRAEPQVGKRPLIGFRMLALSLHVEQDQEARTCRAVGSRLCLSVRCGCRRRGAALYCKKRTKTDRTP